MDEKENRHYELHTLFAEFLETKLNDEEGIEIVQLVHRVLAEFYLKHQQYFLSFEHAIDAKEWQMALQSLESIGPGGVGMGYGKLF